MDTKKLFSLIENEVKDLKGSKRATNILKVGNKFYKEAPTENDRFLSFCESLLASESIALFSIATLWVKRRQEVLDIKYFDTIETWIYQYVTDWWRCDQLCNRVISLFIYKYPELYCNVLQWIKSNKVYVRRAAPVSLIKCEKKVSVTYNLKKILAVVDDLKSDSHIHIQKAIGWLLKYSFLTYPNEIINYLTINVNSLSRVSYRYALEKTPKELKQRMMAL